jgi:hypothetical protein
MTIHTVPLEFHMSEIKKCHDATKRAIELLEEVCSEYLKEREIITNMERKVMKLSCEIKILKGQAITIPKPILDR